MIQIITISGIDGSGKSTQTKLLKDHFISQGKKIYYFHVVQFSLLNKLRKKAKQDSSDEKQEAAVTHSSKFGIWLRKLALPIDLWRFKRLLKELEKQGYDILLSDRYFYDTLVNIAYLEKKEDFMCYNIQKPDLAFFFSADPKNIMRRNRAPEQGIRYLTDKQHLYNKLADERKLVKINADSFPHDVLVALLDSIRKVL